MTPDSTPRQALYIETGMLDVETMIDEKRISMMARLKQERSEMMDCVLKNPSCKWMTKTKEVMEKYDILEWELAMEKPITRMIIAGRIKAKFYEKMNVAPEGKSKTIHFLEGKGEWSPKKTAEYMLKLTRKQVSTIFKIRTRMIKVKGNYKNGYSDQQCRACKNSQETQNHALAECPAIHPDGLPNRRYIDPFANDMNILKETARYVEKVVEDLNTVKTSTNQEEPSQLPVSTSI